MLCKDVFLYIFVFGLNSVYLYFSSIVIFDLIAKNLLESYSYMACITYENYFCYKCYMMLLFLILQFNY